VSWRSPISGLLGRFYDYFIYRLLCSPVTTRPVEAVRTLRGDGHKTRASDEHSAELAGQRKEITKAAERSENRLMLLLDQERQAAKESTAQLNDQLARMSDKAQSHREKTIELEATIRELKGQAGKLESGLAENETQFAELTTALEVQAASASSIQREFEAYKKEFKISGDMGALQTAVATMQAKLEERQDK
jgi:chromosome segregation ATPase